LIRSMRAALALLRAASAFLSAVASVADAPVRARPPSGSRRAPIPPLPSRDREGAVSPRNPGIENRCPVCQARFRGARICSRCGADLEPLMRLAVHAWQLRQSAREALGAGDVQRALGLAIEAQGTQGTESGEALRLLAVWLQGTEH